MSTIGCSRVKTWKGAAVQRAGLSDLDDSPPLVSWRRIVAATDVCLGRIEPVSRGLQAPTTSVTEPLRGVFHT